MLCGYQQAVSAGIAYVINQINGIDNIPIKVDDDEIYQGGLTDAEYLGAIDMSGASDGSLPSLEALGAVIDGGGTSDWRRGLLSGKGGTHEQAGGVYLDEATGELFAATETVDRSKYQKEDEAYSGVISQTGLISKRCGRKLKLVARWHTHPKHSNGQPARGPSAVDWANIDDSVWNLIIFENEMGSAVVSAYERGGMYAEDISDGVHWFSKSILDWRGYR